MAFNRNNLVTALALALSAGAVAEDVQVIELGVNTGNNSTTQTVPHRSTQSSEMMIVIQQLQEEVRSLRGQLEQQSYKIKQMERQQLDRYRDLDRRISSVSNKSSVAPTPTTTDSSSSVSAVAEKPDTMVQPDSRPSDSKAYREAFGLVLQRNYPEATNAFKSFINAYPQSARLPNAYYWLGEIYLAEQKPDQAREPFVHVITKFPKHSKAPDAAYKLGIVYDQLGDRTKSREYLDMVINKYPDSAAVKLATEFKRAQ